MEEYRCAKQNDMISLCSEIFQKIYDHSQDRSKPIKSELLTWHFCETVKKYSQMHLLRNFSHMSHKFIQDAVVLEFLETGRVPSHKEIAEKLRTSEANICKHWASIESEVRVLIKDRNS